MTTASQTPGPMPPEASHADRNQGTLAAAAGVITAAMKAGALAPLDIARAELSAGILFDPQAAADIAAAAAAQAHSDDEAEIAERGRQLARMAGDHRKVSAVLRLLEGRPGTDLLTVAQIAVAAEYGSTALDSFPMTLAWTGDVAIPGPTSSSRRAVIKCISSYGGRADLVVQGDARIRLASLIDAEAHDIHAPCPTPGCGEPGWNQEALPPGMSGWACVRIAGVDDVLHWYCSPMCVSAAFARAGEQLAADDQAAAIDPDQQASYGDPLAYGPTGIPCQPDEPVDEAVDLDARYGQGASDEHALQVAEATEDAFDDERGDVDDRDAEGGVR
ncbi:hypothetical protein ACKI10_43175 [Streptomyces galilaeus]|uniref:DUF222 domain-containing protein n=1 Tax=Streptomyces galilaeus TaxID=33899 RepID=A0ABW9IXH6_STRGJ